MKTRKRNAPPKKRSRRPAPGRARRRGVVARDDAPRLGGDAAALALAAECTVAEADSLKAALIGRLEEPRPVIVDVGSLKRIDTAGLQLLAAFVRDRRSAGRKVAWRGRAPALDAAAALLGLRGMLELPLEDER